MFYLKREREERAAGRSERAALEAAAATSGRSVLISGLTVMVAMAGMFLTGDETFASFGVATIAGRRDRDARLADRPAGAALEARRPGRPRAGPARRPPAPRRRRGPDLGRDRRPRPPAARRCRRSSPAGCSSRSRSPRSSCAWCSRARTRSRSRSPVVKTYDRMQQAFPGTALPANVVVKAPNVNAPAVRAAIDRLEQRALASGRMHEPITVDVNDDRHGREHHHPDRRQRAPTRESIASLSRAPRRDRPDDGRRAPERRGRRHRA